MRNPGNLDAPPFMLRAAVEGRDLSDIARAAILRSFPVPYELDFSLLTASSAMKLLPALAGHGPVHMHVPAPDGLPGGYPALVDAGRVQVELPAGWTLQDAIASNVASLPWDGLDRIETVGTIVFTQGTSCALFDLTGKRYDAVTPGGAADMARTLVAAAAG